MNVSCSVKIVFLSQVLTKLAACRSRLTLSALILGMILQAATPLHAQLKTKVSVDPSQSKAVLYTTSIGIAADRWEQNAYDPATLQLLQEAGFTNLRFPGNNGIDALYHWSTGTITNPYTDDRAPAFPREKQFPAVVPVIDKLGTAIVSVNYGTNLDGSGGGEPAEAAAWVAYANGSPSNSQAIGKDSKGNDWKTVGFWASLRAATPLATDDGYNHLRIGHAAPLGILLWTVGNEPWNNGFYGQGHNPGSDADTSGKYGEAASPEPDLHDGKVKSSRDWGRHQSDAKVGPAAYGAAVVEYVKAMKAVDPKILVGAFVMQPPYAADADQRGKNWNASVLKAACASMDFSAAAFWEGKGAEPTLVDNVDEEDLLMLARDPMDVKNHFPGGNGLHYDYTQLARDLVEKYKKFCPSNHMPPLGYYEPRHCGLVASQESRRHCALLGGCGHHFVRNRRIHGSVVAHPRHQPDTPRRKEPGATGLLWNQADSSGGEARRRFCRCDVATRYLGGPCGQEAGWRSRPPLDQQRSSSLGYCYRLGSWLQLRRKGNALRLWQAHDRRWQVDHRIADR